ncbi:UNVERIFIED_CONTAM: GTPase activating protein [Siphonaria sp. JEL0065]|nr:GTPase activating protein [Siphonaria sp. JEL0065]
MTTTTPPKDANRVRLVFAKSNIVRQSAIGFLCIISFPIAASISDVPAPPATNKAFVWIPKGDIDPPQLSTFRRVAKSTRALFGPNPPPSPVSPLPHSNASSSLAVNNTAQQHPPRASSPLDFLFGSSSTTATPTGTPTITEPPSPGQPRQPLTINTSPLDDYITLPQSAHLCPISSIKTLIFEIALSVSTTGDEACLVKLKFDYGASDDDSGFETPTSSASDPNDINEEEQENDPDALWFDRDEDGKESLTLESVVSELHVWLVKTCAKGLRPIFSVEGSGGDGINSRGIKFQVLDVSELGKNEDGKIMAPINPNSKKVERTTDWPIALPISETSTVYRLGRFGLGVASAIVGPSLSQKVEGLTRNAAWDVMDQFTKVTKLAQDTGRQVVEHPLARPVLPLIPTQITNMLLSSEEAEELLNDYDSAQIYLAKFADSIQEGVKNRLKKRKQQQQDGIAVLDKEKDFERLTFGYNAKLTRTSPLPGEQWVLLFDEKGKLSLPEEEMRSIIFFQGVHHDCRRDVWKFLLKMYAFDSNEPERVERLKGLTAQYESMKRQWQNILADAENQEMLGTPISPRRSSSPTKERDASATTPVGDESLEGDVVSKMKERKHRVEKDVVRTDRTIPYFQGVPEDTEILLKSPTSPTFATTKLSKNLDMLKSVLLTYTIFNFDLGYVQGMNDLLSPILETMDDEVEAFWCFVNWMELKKGNFSRDQSGMRQQLHLLELLIKFMDPPLYAHLGVTTLWEAIWSCPLTQNLHFFIALAILNKHRTSIMTECAAFDEALKYMNDLSGTLDVEAEVLFSVFKVQLNKAMSEPGVGFDVGPPSLVTSRRASASSVIVGDEIAGAVESATKSASNEGLKVSTGEDKNGGGLSRSNSRLSVRSEKVGRERSVSPGPPRVRGEELFELFLLLE